MVSLILQSILQNPADACQVWPSECPYHMEETEYWNNQTPSPKFPTQTDYSTVSKKGHWLMVKDTQSPKIDSRAWYHVKNEKFRRATQCFTPCIHLNSAISSPSAIPT